MIDESISLSDLKSIDDDGLVALDRLLEICERPRIDCRNCGDEAIWSGFFSSRKSRFFGGRKWFLEGMIG